MAIVADSSPLIGMVRIARLGLLRELYQRVLIPETVHQEVVIEGKRLRKAGVPEIERALRAGWIRVVPLAQSQLNRVETYRASGGIGRGEAEAITLAVSKKLPVIIDDRHARELADVLGVDFMGTAAVLLEAHLKGFLSKKEFAESLRELGKVMWLSPEIIVDLLRLAEETKR